MNVASNDNDHHTLRVHPGRSCYRQVDKRIDPLFFSNRHGIADYYSGVRHPSTEGIVDNGSPMNL